MDNNKSYIERRKRYSRSAHRRKAVGRAGQWNTSLFLLRINICMGALVLIVIASYIDSKPTNTFCDNVQVLVEKNTQLEDIRTFAEAMYNCISQGDISVMAENNSSDFYLDQEVVKQIENKKSDSQKKTE